MNKVISSSVNILDQLHDFIVSIDAVTYQTNHKPLFDSSIGQHLRHILDMFQALIQNSDAPVINYDIRQRGIPLETVQQEGIIALKSVRKWMENLNENDLKRCVTIHTEVDIAEQYSAQFKSSFGRELAFASTHAVHHLALMATIAKVSGCQVDAQYGVAPATATYQRSLLPEAKKPSQVEQPAQPA
ncbi:DinB family protein [Amphritea balenae]|uniref:DinB family protein n=1 Tax=Amphritea balenae TaxID=452629 RepID=A0A3P1SKM8_9GAMM|nr:DinB family protein [Amphritea balenae]RRC97607.1 DinB family protein [Amphritea balenae]GGK73719.1 hypothetical protein GCM10007941_24740 [Amphritea balenae]